jgi:asparagine N-glycosylation enzyme membrane subunit Stt3
MALLALLALLRSALDPVDNIYYHAPLLLALLGWDALSASRSLPLRGFTGAAIALAFWHWTTNDLVDVAAFNAVYVGVAAVALLVISASLFRPGRRFTGYPLSAAPACPQTRVFGG